jgi:PTH1 family peptidyl-tRNA hydrolase
LRLLRRGSGSSLDALVVGLGNPGPRYARTRHNAGFLVVDRLAAELDVTLSRKFEGRFAEATLDDTRIGLLEPETFMNVSGSAVGKASRFYKLRPDQVIVVHDDIDLAFGRVRAKLGGGLKGHNGLRSTAESLGSPEFARVRFGVGRPGRGDRRDIAAFVLAPFEPHEDVEPLVAEAVRCSCIAASEGIEAALLAYP